MSNVAVRVANLRKEFSTDQGEVNAIQGISFDVEAGAFFTLLGPSGCGKSTTLRCIAGLERPDEGEIVIDGTVVISTQRGVYVPPNKRPIGMVFQSYAIWPHMNVFDNVAFPLTQGKARLPRGMVRNRVMEALHLVQLDGLEKRPAPQLSGGQQQRLALARALVREPKALLLDEPLSNLDAKLREEMRVELKLLTQRLGITTIFVTHDQLEALTLSDCIAIMQSGRIVQFGNARDIYMEPTNKFAAQFIGTTNLFEGTVASSINEHVLTVDTPQGTLVCEVAQRTATGAHVAVTVRPENVHVQKEAPRNGADERCNVLEGKVETVVFLGDALDCRVLVDGLEVRARVHPSVEVDTGDTVYLTVPASACRVIPSEVGAAAPATPAEVGAAAGEA